MCHTLNREPLVFGVGKGGLGYLSRVVVIFEVMVARKTVEIGMITD